jgi:hypothetical protein
MRVSAGRHSRKRREDAPTGLQQVGGLDDVDKTWAEGWRWLVSKDMGADGVEHRELG